MMMRQLEEMFERDLQTLRGEIQSYAKEEDLWKVGGAISNSAGTLTLHLAGNLQHYVGALIGGSGYQRDRDAEFSRRNVPRDELLSEIDRAAAAVSSTLGTLSDENLDDEFPEVYREERRTLAYMLPHILSHFNYHLGQVNYHRRLLTGPLPVD